MKVCRNHEQPLHFNDDWDNCDVCGEELEDVK